MSKSVYHYMRKLYLSFLAALTAKVQVSDTTKVKQ